MPSKKLTARNVKTLPATNGSRTDYHDKTLPGFMLRVSPNGGSRSFAVRYDVRDTVSRKRRYMKVGDARIMKLANARDEARKILNDVARGADPAKERKKEDRKASPMTVGEFLDVYLERHSKPNKKTWEEDERRVERIKDKLGKVALQDLSTAHCADLHTGIGKTAQVEANRTVQLLTAALNKAVEWGHLDEGERNPAKRVKRFSERSRERFLERDELPRVLKALESLDDVSARSALKLILLAGLRKSEALSLKWRYVDLEARTIRLPETKNGKGRTVPLTNEAVDLLESLPQAKNNPYVFAGHHRGKPISVSTVDRRWREVRKAAGVEDVTIHDLRRTCGSWLAMQGVGIPIIGKILGHSSARATEIYARLQADAGREALEGWGEQIAEITSPQEELEAK